MGPPLALRSDMPPGAWAHPMLNNSSKPAKQRNEMGDASLVLALFWSSKSWEEARKLTTPTPTHTSLIQRSLQLWRFQESQPQTHTHLGSQEDQIFKKEDVQKAFRPSLSSWESFGLPFTPSQASHPNPSLPCLAGLAVANLPSCLTWTCSRGSHAPMAAGSPLGAALWHCSWALQQEASPVCHGDLKRRSRQPQFSLEEN